MKNPENTMDNRSGQRWASLLGGGLLMAWGLKQRGWAGWPLALLGLGMAASGAGAKRRLTAREDKGGIKIEESILIKRPAHEIYAYWRHLQNLPLIMRHVKSVEPLDELRSRWTVEGPMGKDISWEARIINDFHNKLITWESLEDADVVNAGSVSFTPLEDGRHTIVKVKLRFDPPAGRLGAAVAHLLGDQPAHQIGEDLLRFKLLLEAGQGASLGMAKESLLQSN